MARPILVIGKNRSGTKWLSNLLCNHTAVAGVQSEHHNGIVETNFFGQLERAFGELDRIESYVGLVESWAQTDFARAAGFDKAKLYSLRPRPASYAALFRLVMDDVAHRTGASHWLQKTSPLLAERVLDSFPDAHIVIIRRDMLSTVHSMHRLARRNSDRTSLVRATIRFVLEDRVLDRIARVRTPICTSYDALKRDARGEVAKLCRNLGLEYQRDMEVSRWKRNTSFHHADPVAALDRRERLAIKAVAALSRSLPLETLRWARAVTEPRGARFVRGSYRMIVNRYDLE